MENRNDMETILKSVRDLTTSQKMTAIEMLAGQVVEALHDSPIEVQHVWNRVLDAATTAKYLMIDRREREKKDREGA